MFFVRLAQGGIIELPDAFAAELEGESLVLRAADGHIVCRLPRADVLAYSARIDLLVPDSDSHEPTAP